MACLTRSMGLPKRPCYIVGRLYPGAGGSVSLRQTGIHFHHRTETLTDLNDRSRVPRLLSCFAAYNRFCLIRRCVRKRALTRRIHRGNHRARTRIGCFLGRVLPIIQFIRHGHVVRHSVGPPGVVGDDLSDQLILVSFNTMHRFLTSVSSIRDCRTPTDRFIKAPNFTPPRRLTLHPYCTDSVCTLNVAYLFLLATHAPVRFSRDPHAKRVL